MCSVETFQQFLEVLVNACGKANLTIMLEYQGLPVYLLCLQC